MKMGAMCSHAPAFLPRGNGLQFPLYSSLGRHKTRSGRCEEEKKFFPLPEIQPRFLGRHAGSVFATPIRYPASFLAWAMLKTKCVFGNTKTHPHNHIIQKSGIFSSFWNYALVETLSSYSWCTINLHKKQAWGHLRNMPFVLTDLGPKFTHYI